MKIRALTIGLELLGADFEEQDALAGKISKAGKQLKALERHLIEEDYEVQTRRLSLSSFELWLPRETSAGREEEFDVKKALERFSLLSNYLDEAGITFCTIGCATTKSGIELLGEILPVFPVFSSSALIQNDGHTPVVELAEAAGRIVKILADCTPDGTANFRFCTAFNCPPNIPFFPVSYHESGAPPTLTVGMECGDLLFLAFHGVTDLPTASRNLESAYTQLTQNLEATLIEACDKCCEGFVQYGGIDASMNPGLTIQDSVGLGCEQLPPNCFGGWGTLAIVSTITRAIKSLKDKVKLVGYNGLMLPVMEDITLAERAAEKKSRYSLRDLLLYSSVCGVGLDTVPVPGNTSVEELVRLYMDIGTMAFRLNKPLTCRLFLMPGLAAGEMTHVQNNPYLVNTKVFSVE